MAEHDSSEDRRLSSTYTFTLDASTERSFTVTIDEETLLAVDPTPTSLPDWTRLEVSKCANCPLDTATHPHCPAAVRLIDIIDFFRDSISWEEADITVETHARTYMKRTSLQQGISSLMGLRMATSECPILNQLRSMARFHLPFSDPEETTYRVLSIYLLGQYYRHRETGEADWDLHHLTETYDDIQVVNKSFWQRMRHVAKMQDANVNALVILDNFANFVVGEIDSKILEKLVHIFSLPHTRKKHRQD